MRVSISELLTGGRVFTPLDRASTLIGYLKESGSYDAFVEEEGWSSIVTMKDLLEVQDLETKLSTVMRRVPRLNAGDTIGDAASLMFEHRTLSMPVYKRKRFVGRIAAPEIIERLLDTDQTVDISSIMTPEPVTLGSSVPIAAAREMMRKMKVDQIPILDGGRLVNVITSSDLVFNLAPPTDRDERGDTRKKRNEDPVGVFGKAGLVTNAAADGLQAVFTNMKNKGANYSVITDKGRVRGIATYRDFMKILTRKDGGPALPMYIIGVPEDLLQASLVRNKFAETVELLKHVLPDVEEARAVIEADGNNPSKKKNLVKVTVISPRRNYSYQVFSYDLSEAFDQVHNWAKRLVEQEKPSVKRGRRNTIERRGRVPEFPDE